MYPDLPRKQRETRILRQHPAIFIIGIGWPLKMGIRLTKETLRKQLEISKQLDFLKLPYHQAILNDQIPLSIGGTIGQSRTLMLLLRKAHLGEVSVTVWPKILKEMWARKHIFVLECWSSLWDFTRADLGSALFPLRPHGSCSACNRF